MVGCSVEVGAGVINPISVDVPIDQDSITPPVSFDVDTEFLSAEQTTEMADHYQKQLHAIDHIALQIDELAITDDAGNPIDGSSLTLEIDGVTIDGAKPRVRLTKWVKKEVVESVGQREAVTLPVQITVGWPPDEPKAMTAHARLQPIVVVNGLEAL